MAIIERAQYTGSKISTDSPNVPLDPKVASTQGRMFMQLGEGMSEVAGQLEKAHSLAEQTKAENQRDLELAKIEQQAALDPDTSIEKNKQYHEQMEAVIHQTAQGISIDSAKDSFLSNSQYKVGISKIKVDGAFRKRLVDNAKADANLYLDNTKNTYITSSNMAEKMAAITARDSKLDEMADAGYITKEHASKEKIRLQEVWDTAHVLYDVENNPEQSLEELKKGQKGFYKGAPEDIIAKGIHRAEVKVRQNEKKAKYIQQQKQADVQHYLMDLQNNGLLRPQDLEESFLTKQISNTFYSSMKKVMDNPDVVTAQTDRQTYYDLTHDLVNGDMSEEQASVKILEAVSAGKLSQEDAKKIYQMNLIPLGQNRTSIEGAFSQSELKSQFDKIKNSVDKRNKELAEQKSWLRSGMSMISNFFSNSKDKSVEATRSLYDRVFSNNVSAKDIPLEASKIIKESARQEYPGINNLNGIPNSSINLSSGFKNIDDEKSDVQPTHKVQDGKIIPTTGKKSYSIGDIIEKGGKRLRVISSGDDPEVEEVK